MKWTPGQGLLNLKHSNIRIKKLFQRDKFYFQFNKFSLDDVTAALLFALTWTLLFGLNLKEAYKVRMTPITTEPMIPNRFFISSFSGISSVKFSFNLFCSFMIGSGLGGSFDRSRVRSRFSRIFPAPVAISYRSSHWTGFLKKTRPV